MPTDTTLWHAVIGEDPTIFCQAVPDETSALRLFREETASLPASQRERALATCRRIYRATLREMAADVTEVLPTTRVDVVGGRVQLSRPRGEVFWLSYREAWSLIEIVLSPSFRHDLEDVRRLVLLVKSDRVESAAT